MSKRRRLLAEPTVVPDVSVVPDAWDPSTSPLGIQLLTKVAWGSLSATGLQELALAATQSYPQATDKVLDKLSQIGSRGENQQNCWRDLLRLFPDLQAPSSTIVQIPMITRKSSEPQELEFTMMLPSAWLQQLSSNDIWHKAILGTDGLQSFWDSVQDDDPRWQTTLVLCEM